MRKGGFTLIELIVVIAIVAILAAVIAPNAFKAIDKAKITGTIADYKAVKTGVMAFYADCGVWPVTTTTGGGLVSNTGGTGGVTTTGWDGPYIEKWPSSAKWGGTYAFNSDSTVNWDATAGGDAARYFVVTSVPSTAANSLDIQLDGTAGSASGMVRYGAAPITVNMLISTEVALN